MKSQRCWAIVTADGKPIKLWGNNLPSIAVGLYDVTYFRTKYVAKSVCDRLNKQGWDVRLTPRRVRVQFED